jgi:outer membrane protein assembly factor BamE
MLMSANLPCSARRNAPLILALAVVSATLFGCGSFDGAKKLVDPYKFDIVQGNFVSKEQVDALRPGMSRQQIREILGTPLLTSVFHADRWDYVFSINRQYAEPQEYKLTLYFKGDILDRFEGDTMPTEAEFVSRLNSGFATRAAPMLEAPEESLVKYAPAAPATPPQASPPPASTTYPPLEAPSR